MQEVSLNDPLRRESSTVAKIAEETATSEDVVRLLYEEEVSALESQARVKQFVRVIATRLVKQRLRKL